MLNALSNSSYTPHHSFHTKTSVSTEWEKKRRVCEWHFKPVVDILRWRRIYEDSRWDSQSIAGANERYGEPRAGRARGNVSESSILYCDITCQIVILFYYLFIFIIFLFFIFSYWWKSSRFVALFIVAPSLSRTLHAPFVSPVSRVAHSRRAYRARARAGHIMLARQRI